ncbi:hypothetical protein SNOG_02692 [Parastagonospora nodorum SN15]|uniref:Uncharacterized protein n=1 Tax=Phaeosphaeria nodorum (strain SN15 / ATCC MYA-4574 / FGSC 10173) TaxID=321614 RepID=Q0UZX2_PHANO|nr:hypothetical protein SNOG_02692 [Parastagonospora nodorum SN15]EAT89423.1 hypothetical protein SNOG_02692 [Parastagonospora nodorum SN15]
MPQNSSDTKKSQGQPAAKPMTEKEQEPKPEMIANLRNIKDHPASWMTYGDVTVPDALLLIQKLRF